MGDQRGEQAQGAGQPGAHAEHRQTGADHQADDQPRGAARGADQCQQRPAHPDGDQPECEQPAQCGQAEQPAEHQRAEQERGAGEPELFLRGDRGQQGRQQGQGRADGADQRGTAVRAVQPARGAPDQPGEHATDQSGTDQHRAHAERL
ncbi:hypothetical protein [Kutzneria albida]|uniref:hypothetical protein n=1 Tax=Kutzneria albida TaxID=43357 RepID=UPI00046CCE39|nr:hypothetical protein [Kutzneria albida]